MMAKNEEISLHLAFLLFQLYVGLNKIKPVIMVLDLQRQLPACSPHSLIRAFVVTMQNGWNNRIRDGCVYAQIRRGLGMHLVTYSNHDTVLFLLIVPIKGRFV